MTSTILGIWSAPNGSSERYWSPKHAYCVQTDYFWIKAMEWTMGVENGPNFEANFVIFGLYGGLFAAVRGSDLP